MLIMKKSFARAHAFVLQLVSAGGDKKKKDSQHVVIQHISLRSALASQLQKTKITKILLKNRVLSFDFRVFSSHFPRRATPHLTL